MKRILCLLFILLSLSALCGCERTQFVQTDELEAIYAENRELLETAADAIQAAFADADIPGEGWPNCWIYREGGIEWINEPSVVHGMLCFHASFHHEPGKADPREFVLTETLCDELYPAVEPLFSASVVDRIFRNDRTIQFIVQSEWGQEALIAYQPNGGEPSGSFSEAVLQKEVAPNW
ncbi:MAG: hypothetical protein IJK24_00475 [Oscillospiraceae bacterium]|nr:hypothetical protein [Oscillospiraceae bacterium]MBQ6159397.1 hypothetical protein [Oscillospiraceae bacterium]